MYVIGLSAFWQAFIVLIVFIPLALMWVFALVELFKQRNRHAGWQVALWLFAIALFPIVGPASYLIYRGFHSEVMQDALGYGDTLDTGSRPDTTAGMNR